MKKIDILHIYPGTSGSSGLYTHEIFKSLEKHYHQEIIVSYNFPFSYGKKIYYRFTDLAKPNFIHRNNLLRLAIRYFESFPYSLIISIVAIARPAPLTMQPILPSNFM